MRRNSVVMLVVILTVTAMLVVGRRMARQSGAGLAPDAQALPTEVKGAQAPDFQLVSLSDPGGKLVKLSDYRGKGVLLNFWATWCEPCKVEMPWFVEFQKKYADQGLVVLGVAQDDSSKDAIMKFARDMGVNYQVLQGKNAVGDAYAVQGLPTTVYIGRDGKIIDRVVGLVSKSEIEDNIKLALASKDVTKDTK
ncbi:MAG: TlpA family protein disulfide reductase [Candidatus Koribacter versatilis]|uniref:TlpA family protein disulfide reductase n=1 Tax=Candidatus Korobacter versatilis TaxID=658062 RepID=A0A932A8C9_9BACT|nr:TlpA family protein disulfide reductase [Candidatus Koribacter versatilis]